MTKEKKRFEISEVKQLRSVWERVSPRWCSLHGMLILPPRAIVAGNFPPTRLLFTTNLAESVIRTELCEVPTEAPPLDVYEVLSGGKLPHEIQFQMEGIWYNTHVFLGPPVKWALDFMERGYQGGLRLELHHPDTGFSNLALRFEWKSEYGTFVEIEWDPDSSSAVAAMRKIAVACAAAGLSQMTAGVAV